MVTGGWKDGYEPPLTPEGNSLVAADIDVAQHILRQEARSPYDDINLCLSLSGDNRVFCDLERWNGRQRDVVAEKRRIVVI